VLAQLAEQKMHLKEMRMRSREVLNEYYEAEDNEFAKRELDDTRKSRLTLKHLNRLRKQREVHNIEHANRLEKIKKVYAKPAG
jgi:hypothetical protein